MTLRPVLVSAMVATLCLGALAMHAPAIGQIAKIAATETAPGGSVHLGLPLTSAVAPAESNDDGRMGLATMLCVALLAIALSAARARRRLTSAEIDPRARTGLARPAIRPRAGAVQEPLVPLRS